MAYLDYTIDLNNSLNRLGAAFNRLRGEQDQQAESSGRTANALRGFKNDIVFSERMVSAFSRTLMHMGASMNEVTRGFLGVGVALAGGFGAVEGVIAVFRLIQAFTGILEHQREVAFRLQETYRNLQLTLINGFAQIQRDLGGKVSPVWDFWNNQVSQTRGEIEKLNQEDERLREQMTHGWTKAGLIFRKTFEDLIFTTQMNKMLVGQEHLWDVGGQQRRVEIEKEVAAKIQALRDQEGARDANYLLYKKEMERRGALDVEVARAQLADKVVQIEKAKNKKLDELRLEAYAKDAQGREVGKGEGWLKQQTKEVEDVSAEQIRRIWRQRGQIESAERRKVLGLGMSDEYSLNLARLNAIDALQEEYVGRTRGRDQEEFGRRLRNLNEYYTKRAEIMQRERDQKAIDEQWKEWDERDKKLVEASLSAWQHRNDIDSAFGNESTARKLRRIDQEVERERQIERDRFTAKLIDQVEYNKRLQRIEDDANKERTKVRAEWANPGIDAFVQSWETGFDQILAGTYQWGSLMKNVYMTVVGAMASMLKDFVSKQIQEWLRAGAAWVAQKLVELTVHETVEEGKEAATIAATPGIVTAEAAQGAAAAGASAAVLPGIGWMIAIPAAAAVFGALIGYLASAAGGWDLPKGGPFPTMLHGEEMVLPSHIANPLRSMVAGGGGGGRTINASINVDTMDSKGFERVLRDPVNRSILLRLLSEAVGDNRLS